MGPSIIILCLFFVVVFGCVCVFLFGIASGGDDPLGELPNVPLEDASGVRPHMIAAPISPSELSGFATDTYSKKKFESL